MLTEQVAQGFELVQVPVVDGSDHGHREASFDGAVDRPECFAPMPAHSPLVVVCALEAVQAEPHALEANRASGARDLVAPRRTVADHPDGHPALDESLGDEGPVRAQQGLTPAQCDVLAPELAELPAKPARLRQGELIRSGLARPRPTMSAAEIALQGEFPDGDPRREPDLFE